MTKVLPKFRRERNIERAKKAELAVQAHAEATGLAQADVDVWVLDLLCNLRHYCDYAGLDFGQEMKRANAHYEAEVDPKDDIG